MSQVNTIVLHVRAEQAEEFEREWAADELPRWNRFHAEGKFISARFYRSEYGSDERPETIDERHNQGQAGLERAVVAPPRTAAGNG